MEPFDSSLLEETWWHSENGPDEDPEMIHLSWRTLYWCDCAVQRRRTVPSPKRMADAEPEYLRTQTAGSVDPKRCERRLPGKRGPQSVNHERPWVIQNTSNCLFIIIHVDSTRGCWDATSRWDLPRSGVVADVVRFVDRHVDVTWGCPAGWSRRDLQFSLRLSALGYTECCPPSRSLSGLSLKLIAQPHKFPLS